MKTLFTILCLSFLFEHCSAQTHWLKDTLNNPVLTTGPAGTWDDYSLTPSCLLFLDDSTYHLWYGGHDGTHIRIGYATSTDGVNWEKYAENPVIDLGPGGSWDDVWVYKPYIIFDGSTYHMWYTGFDGSNSRIGYATSPDRVTWTRSATNPVLNLGLAGSWDEGGVENPCILLKDSIYHMWYNGWDGPNTFHIGYAISSDGVNWTRYDGNPVLDMGPAGSWDRPRVQAPEVLFDGRTYHMWYTGGANLWSWDMGYATSTDGVNWDKYDDPATTEPLYSESDPVLKKGPTGSWDDQFVGFARIIPQSIYSSFEMLYGGGAGAWDGHMGYATASVDSPVGFEDYDISFLPQEHSLNQNYPNPFNPITNIEFQISNFDHVDLSIYNLLGQKVATLVKKKQHTGKYKVQWDASGFASGVYFYMLNAGEFKQVRKMIFLK